MVLTFIAEVLAGETMVTPGGAVDMATATGMEAFTWDGWLDQFQSEQEATQTSPEADSEAASPAAEALTAE